MEVKHNVTFTQGTKKVSLVLGTILISLGFILLMQFDVIHEYIIKSAMDFSPNSKSYAAWVTNDPPNIINFYLFNWTNAYECLIDSNCTKYKFEEIGPYSFYEVKDKIQVGWHPNKTVSFKYKKRYYFADAGDNRKLTDEITTINPVALTFAHKIRFASMLVKLPTSLGIFSMSNLVTTQTVEDFLFNGFQDHILNTGSLLDKNVPNRFGYFYNKNNTISENEMLMHHGLDESFGKLLLLNGENRTSNYEGSCGEVRGSAGEFLPMYSNMDYIEIYSTELCSFARLDYEGNVTIKGINAYKYGSRSLFDNGTIYPEYACFCSGECLPTGVQNVTLCKQHSPIFLSLPHFYNADPYFLSSIEGLHPDKEKHEVQITIEPKSSIVLDIGLRVQINIYLHPIEGIRMFENVPTLLVPLLYFDQTITLEDSLLDQIRLIQQLPDYAKIVSIWMIIAGGVLIGIAILLFVFVRVKNEDSKIELKKISGL